MSIDLDPLHVCIGCQIDGLNFPCRDENGDLRVERLIRAYLASREADGDAGIAEFWAADCIDELVSKAPERAIRFIREALPYITSDEDIAFFAAGPLENLVAEHGVSVIDEIEQEARQSSRFRFLLSGIWGRDRTNPEVWRRIQNAVGSGPWLDEDPRTPQGSAKDFDTG